MHTRIKISALLFFAGAALSVAPLSAAALTFDRPLAIGSTGPDVTALQQQLESGSYLHTDPTGYFGTLTEAAVAAFQQANGLDGVGAVGPKTRDILNAAVSSAPIQLSAVPAPATAGLAISRTLALGSSGNDVSALQQFLKTAEYYDYPTFTGYFGPVTAQAVAAFQSAHALEPVGSVGPKTRALLASISANNNVASTATVPGSAALPPLVLGTSTQLWLQPPPPSTAPISPPSSGGGGGGGGGSSPAPAPDTTPPSISFATPTAGQTISASLLSSPLIITASASDSSGIASVQFMLDSTPVGAQLTSAPYTISIDTSAYNNASHTLAAIAKDTAGNYATSTISVTFANTWPNSPLIGAIRWDAWYATSTDATTSENFVANNYGVNASLFTSYSYREPTFGWFDHGAVSNEQAIIDQEILDASNGGLDYWSFDWYHQDSGTTSAELMAPFNDYMASQYHNRLKFTFMLSNTTASYWDSSEVPYVVSKFQDGQYLKTSDNRPVVFWFGASGLNGTGAFGPNWRTELNNLTNADAAVGLGPPLFIDNNMDLVSTEQYGFDGATSYGPSGSGVGGAGGHCYSAEVAVEKANWSTTAQAGLLSVPGLSPVNDGRPRNATSWVQQPTYSQWEQQLKDAYTWVASASSTTVTNPRLMLTYAWNEIDEGGPGIEPTVQDGTKYLDAIKAVKSGTYPAAYTDTYNGDDCSITYVGNSWFYNFPVDGYENDEQVSTQNGDTASLTVASTTAFAVTGIIGPNRGKMQVSIDGAATSTVNLFASATSTKQTLFSSGTLPEGAHTIQITNVSDIPGQTWVGIDTIAATRGR